MDVCKNLREEMEVWEEEFLAPKYEKAQSSDISFLMVTRCNGLGGVPIKMEAFEILWQRLQKTVGLNELLG